ncbi:hypothetical protein ACHWQZ_G005309 [Mnemiopsis leidyi]
MSNVVKFANILFGCINLFLGFTGMFLNLMIFWGWKRTRSRSSNCLIHITISNMIAGTLAVVLGLHLMNQREKLPADVLFCQIPGVLVNLNQISTPLLLSIATIERIIAIAFPVRFSQLSFNHPIYWIGFSISWIWGCGVSVAPYIAGHRMHYKPDWATCDFKMTDIFPDHHTAGYFLVLFALAVPLIISWFIIVAGNAIVAVKLFASPIKRAKQNESGTGNSASALPPQFNINKNNIIPTVMSVPENVRPKTGPRKEDRSHSIISETAVNVIMSKQRMIRTSISGMTKLEAAVIKCTLSLSFNYLVIQFIFIMQVLVYVFDPETSVFDLIAVSPTGQLYATLWYYMAMPVTGFVNTIMLLKHNKNLRMTIRKMIVKMCYNVGVICAKCAKSKSKAKCARSKSKAETENKANSCGEETG